MSEVRRTFPSKSGRGGFQNNRNKFSGKGRDDGGDKWQKRKNFHNNGNEEQIGGTEMSTDVNRFQRKANFNRSQKLGEKFVKKQPEFKSKGKAERKWKNEPVKGTSTEYGQLAPSDEDDDEIPDVSDMLGSEEVEIPLINTEKRKPTKRLTQTVSNGFNALGEDEKVKNPPKKEIVEENEEGEEDESDEEDDDEEERKKFREEIANMPLGKVKEMKEKLGIKLFNKTYFGMSEEEKSKQAEKKQKMEEEKTKLGKNRPKEMSTKRPVSAFRNVYGDHEQSAKKKKWDPRFDSRAGDFKEICFENNYEFLDDIKKNEMEEMRNQYNLARTGGDERTAQRLKNTLQKMETREKTRAEKRRQAETRKELHEENIQRMLQGEAPVFKTKADVRKIDMEKKFNELKKDNKLDKYLQRKSKKNAAKQKKARPFDGYGYQE